MIEFNATILLALVNLPDEQAALIKEK